MPKPNLKETLLDTGLAAFHRHGYHATGVQDIVSLAGVPKGSFYSHFESKDALSLAAIARYLESRAEARALLRTRSGPGPNGSTAISRRLVTARMVASSAISPRNSRRSTPSVNLCSACGASGRMRFLSAWRRGNATAACGPTCLSRSSRARSWRSGKTLCSRRRSSAAPSHSTWRVAPCGFCWRPRSAQGGNPA